ncbi:HNH endonuclease signature motif containing protein [Mycolicibacterium confluentis]|uniref:DUF222 domain-containing protein n=1 Tax=Mycolicibacterium confluentis TaxID=28047 RepID=A0A7I7XY80_9MYCO|nr:HNH endonuclease signature motif containing protein [Mycolicibacterium confluentis]BBZ34325.1 hypothetical protein MCNF_29300 [Mycolicibacterium confluentis]
MFDDDSPDGLLTEIEACHRFETMLIGRRMAAIARLVEHRTYEAEADDPDPGYCIITGLTRTSAEIGAALNLAPKLAQDTVAHAEALDTRLPLVGALLRGGDVDWPTVKLILTRTEYVTGTLMPQIDAQMTQKLTTWSSWSRRRVIDAVDAAIRTLDPEAAKERRVHAEAGRHVTVTAQPDGTAQLRGILTGPGAAILDARLAAMATSVCAADSRTVRQRRADALTALNQDQLLSCDCGQAQCPSRTAAHTAAADAAAAAGARGEGARAGGAATGAAGVPAVRTVINVVASAATVSGDSDQPGYLQGFGIIDAAQVRDLVPTALLRPVSCPTLTATAAQAHTYTPSAGLARFIKTRDLTCRFPGCDRPAWFADLDHTTPFHHTNPTAGGLTAPWNLGCYCREHHRDKTFLDWTDQQQGDGTIVWTSPTGRTYTTTPAGAELFPDLLGPPPAPDLLGAPPAPDLFGPPPAPDLFGPPPPPRRRHRQRDKARRHTHARAQLTAHRPRNAEQRRLNAARRQEIDQRQWRNHMRRMLHLFKGTPSTSPWCTWVNDPPEPETLPPDWQPPPPPPIDDTEEPPF